MPYDFVLPDFGEGITEGEIRRWLIKEGDAVEEHQTVLEIETDKAVVEVPSPKKGKVFKIHKEIADIAKVCEALMTIADVGVAVDTPDGLMVPVIKNADKKTILELAAEIQGLSVKAREKDNA